MNARLQELVRRIEANDPTLTEVEQTLWEGFGVRQAGYLSIARALQKNTHLQTIRLQQLEPTSIYLVMMGIALCTSLRTLCLNGFARHDPSILRDEANTVLTIKSDFVDLAMRMSELRKNPQLFETQVQLIGEDTSGKLGVGQAFQFLRKTSIQNLEITDISRLFTDVDMAYLSVMLAASHSLRKLKLSISTLNVNQLRMLGEGLNQNPELKEIDLDVSDFIGEKSDFFPSLMRSHPKLELLTIDCINFPDGALENILTALKDHHGLVDLKISGLFSKSYFSSSSKTWQAIQALLLRNRIRVLFDNIISADVIADDGSVSEDGLKKMEELVAQFVQTNADNPAAKGLQDTFSLFKKLLSKDGAFAAKSPSKEEEIAHHFILDCMDPQFREIFSHLFGLRLMISGQFLAAIHLLKISRLSVKQIVGLGASVFHDEDLRQNHNFFNQIQKCQLVLILLACVRDPDELLYRRALTLAVNEQGGRDFIDRVGTLHELTGADVVIKLAECTRALKALQAASDNPEFKALNAEEIKGEGGFQLLIEKMKNEAEQLKMRKVEIPKAAAVVEQNLDKAKVIRCYEIIALDPGAGSDVEKKIKNDAADLMAKKVKGTVKERFDAMLGTVFGKLDDIQFDKSHDNEKVLTLALEGIKKYRTLPRTMFSGSHLSVFSILFDRETGLRRADKLEKNISATEGKDQLQRLSELYHFLISHQKLKLKECVLQSLDCEKAHIAGLGMTIAKQLDEEYITKIINAVMKGIEQYQGLDRTSSHSHLNIFSRTWDQDRGVLRANAYRRVFENKDHSLEEKMIVLYSLLKSKDGQKLQSCVIDSVGMSTSLKSILAGYMKLHHPEVQLDKVAKEIYEKANAKPDVGIDLADKMNLRP